MPDSPNWLTAPHYDAIGKFSMMSHAREISRYFRPNFAASLNEAGTRATIPMTAKAKGFYFSAVLRELREQGHHLTGYGPFRESGDYPVTVAFDLLVAASRRLYPDESLREGIRRIAWVMFPALADTIVGRVLFGALGRDLMAAARLAERGFEISLSEGSAEILHLAEGYLEMRVRDFPLLPDCFVVGVLEGWLAYFGRDGEVSIRPGSRLQDMDYLVRWGATE